MDLHGWLLIPCWRMAQQRRNMGRRTATFNLLAPTFSSRARADGSPFSFAFRCPFAFFCTPPQVSSGPVNRNKDGTLANFLICGPLFFIKFRSFLSILGSFLRGVPTPGATSAPPGRPGTIFHRFGMDFGCPWGAFGAPLGSLFGPWALPGRP